MKTRILRVQQGTKIWKRLRGGRITATGMADVLGLHGVAAQIASIAKLKQSMKPDPDSKPDAPVVIMGNAVDWGNTFEDKALDAYETLYETKVTDRNNTFAVVEGRDYLGASPDAFDGDILIEIKCPYSGTIPSERHSQYWIQMQMQMICTGFKRARLVYWRPIPVEQDHVTVKELGMGDWIMVWEYRQCPEVQKLFLVASKALVDEIERSPDMPEPVRDKAVRRRVREVVAKGMRDTLVGVETRMSPGTNQDYAEAWERQHGRRHLSNDDSNSHTGPL